MGAADTQAMTSSSEKSYEEVRKAWRDAHVHPLWENPLAHSERKGGPKPHLWSWRKIRPLLDHAMKVTTPAAVERRVLTLVDPDADDPTAGTTTNLTPRCRSCYPARRLGRTATA